MAKLFGYKTWMEYVIEVLQSLGLNVEWTHDKIEWNDLIGVGPSRARKHEQINDVKENNDNDDDDDDSNKQSTTSS